MGCISEPWTFQGKRVIFQTDALVSNSDVGFEFCNWIGDLVTHELLLMNTIHFNEFDVSVKSQCDIKSNVSFFGPFKTLLYVRSCSIKNDYWKSTNCDVTSQAHQKVNTLRPRLNGRHFPDDILKCIFLNESVWISLKISLKFVPISHYLNQWFLVYWRIYASLGLNELK